MLKRFYLKIVLCVLQWFERINTTKISSKSWGWGLFSWKSAKEQKGAEERAERKISISWPSISISRLIFIIRFSLIAAMIKNTLHFSYSQSFLGTTRAVGAHVWRNLIDLRPSTNPSKVINVWCSFVCAKANICSWTKWMLLILIHISLVGRCVCVCGNEFRLNSKLILDLDRVLWGRPLYEKVKSIK